MQTNNALVYTLGIIIIILLGALFYTNSNNANVAPAAADNSMASHHPNANQQFSTASLDALVGKQVPDFSLTDRESNTYASETLRGKNVILFFNEGLMCYPGCWNQIVALAEDERFKNPDTAVFSVVVDAKGNWQQAINKMPALAEAVVLFDTNKVVSNKLGVLTLPSSMHPGVFPGHTYILIDKAGIVRYVLDDPYMGIHNDQLWAEIQKLSDK